MSKVYLSHPGCQKASKLVSSDIKETAARIGVSHTTLTDFKYGRGISPQKAKRICEWLEIDYSPFYILEVIEDSILKARTHPILPSPHTEIFDEYIKDKLIDFIGREHIYKAFDKFCHYFDRGYFVVLGDPGEGKSAIAAKFTCRYPCLYYFNQGGRFDSAQKFLDKICKQLIDYGDLDEHYNNKFDEEYFLYFLKKVSHQLSEEEKLIIMIDALDEVNLDSQSEHPRSKVLYLPEENELPKNVYFFVTLRRDHKIQKDRLISETSQYVCIYDLALGCSVDFKKFDENIKLANPIEACSEDIDKYLNEKLDHDSFSSLTNNFKNESEKLKFIQTLTIKSERNFLYVTLILPEISHGHINYKDINQIPTGLLDFYEDHLQRKKALLLREKFIPDDIKSDLLIVIHIIGEEGKIALTDSQIAERTGRHSVQHVRFCLDNWSQFFSPNFKNLNRYAYYHHSYNEFLCSQEAYNITGFDREEVNRRIADNSPAIWRPIQ